MSTIPTPPDSRRCTATNRAGSRCKRWALLDAPDGRCSTHTAEESLQSVVVRDPAGAARRKSEKNRRKKQEREDAAYIRSLSLREQVKARIEERSTQIVDRLMELAMDQDATTSLRAIDALWNRSYGRPMQPTVTANVGNVDQSAVNELKAALENLPPEARAELARKQLKLLPKAEEA